MGIITFNGRSSKGIFEVEVPPGYEMPSRVYDDVRVPGRNGTVSFDLKQYENIDRTYEISMGDHKTTFTDLALRISEFLSSEPGYHRLEDSYNPNHYFMARYKDSLVMNNIYGVGVRASIVFDRKPQRFLKGGDVPTIIDNIKKTIQNPTPQIAKPLIRVNMTGSGKLGGTVKVGQYEVQLTDIQSYVYIDCETEDVRKDQINMNKYAVFKDRKCPVLHPGTTTVTFTGSISTVEIIPRWWVV